MHGGILARRDRESDLPALAEHGITPIDSSPSTCIRSRARPRARDIAFDDLVEEIDIGGPSMVRAAAKNFRDVLVVVDPADYDEVLAALAAPDGRPRRFASSWRDARSRTRRGTTGHRVDAGDVSFDESRGAFVRAAARSRRAAGSWRRRCRKSAICATARTLISRRVVCGWLHRVERRGGRGGAALVHQGKELSFTNLLDLDAAARIVLEFDEPAACVIKHTNPCGVATGTAIADAYVRARDADALSAFGGIVGLNRPSTRRPRRHSPRRSSRPSSRRASSIARR